MRQSFFGLSRRHLRINLSGHWKACYQGEGNVKNIPAAIVSLNLTCCAVVGDGSTPVQELRAEAEQGDAIAQLDLGVAYYQGDGVRQNYSEARKWFEKSAQQGVTDAINNMGLLYAGGKGVKQDWRKSLEWYKRAADAGNASAQYNLGVAYDFAHGVKQDHRETAKWYEKAALQGYRNAQNSL
jgi:uncharacterized protein